VENNENYSVGGRKAMSLIGPAAFLGFGGASGLWLGLAQGGVQVALAATVLALTAVLGAVWLVRDRAARRLNAAADAYAEREIARERRLHRPHALRRRGGKRNGAVV
jgi:hypothetical protein